jgi:hypothetical protein
VAREESSRVRVGKTASRGYAEFRDAMLQTVRGVHIETHGAEVSPLYFSSVRIWRLAVPIA